MQLTLYILSGRVENKIHKENYLYQAYQLNGYIKEDCDISNPVITMDCPKDANENDFIFNYCKIEEYGRYYFIDRIVFGLNDIITIYCTCDVLYSFYNSSNTNWYNSNLFCNRRTSGDPFIQDNLREFKYNKVITDVTSSIPVVPESNYEVFDVSSNDKTSRRVVLAVINDLNWSTDAPISATMQAVGKLPSLQRYSNGDMMVTTYYLLTYNSLNSLLISIYSNDTIKTYIKSITILPFQPDSVDLINPTEEHPEGVTFNTIRIGDQTYTMPDNVGYIKYQNYYRFEKENRIMPTPSSFLDYQPYTTYKWFIPYKDYVELNMESVGGCTLSLLYYVNFDDTSAHVIIYNKTKDIIEYQSQCQLGVKIGISSSNQLEINNQQIQMGVSTAISTIAGALAIVGGAASGNALMVGGGITSVVGGIANYGAKANALHVTGETAVGSGYVGIVNPQTSYIIKVTQTPILSGVNYDAYRIDKGIPFNNYIVIANANDNEYIVIDDDNIPMDEKMTKQEFNTLKELLKKGVRK